MYCRQTGTDAEASGLSKTLRALQSLSEVCQGGPETMLPIWKQLLPGLDSLMDGEIFRERPAELDDRIPINHPPPVPIDGHPPQQRPTKVKGFVKASPVPYTHPLDQRRTNLIMLSLCLECLLCMYLLVSHSDYDFIDIMAQTAALV